MDKFDTGFDLLKQLKEKNKQTRYREFKDYISFKARKKGIPISGVFELTPLCNLSCKMCYVHLDADQLRGQSILPTETWKDLIYQAWKAGMISATLTGGECLTYPGFDDLFLYLHSLGCEVGVLTNGILLDEKRIQFFKEHKPSMIQVSLYGWNDEVYERVTGRRLFTTVTNNIRRAIEANLPIYISITPNSYVGEDLLETIRVARELTKTVVINSIYSIPREETGRADQQGDADLELYIRAYQYRAQLEGSEIPDSKEVNLPPCGGSSHECSECGLRCGGGRSSFSIDWKGAMKPCIDLEQIKAYPLQEGFAAAWSKVNHEANLWPRVPECNGCAYEEVCNTCAANMLKYAEPGKQPIGLCEQTKELVRHGVKRLPECE